MIINNTAGAALRFQALSQQTRRRLLQRCDGGSCIVIKRSLTTLPRSSAPRNANSKSIGFSRGVWNAYCRALERRPLLTKATTAAVIFFFSDSATQYLSLNEDERSRFGEKYDFFRASSGGVFGVVATAFLHYWWGALEPMAELVLPSRRYRLANTLFKVVVDQACGAPFYIYGYYIVTNFLQRVVSEHEDWKRVGSETVHKANDMLFPTMLHHWRVWPLVHTVNFYYFPLHHRVLVQNLVLVGWSGYLSHLNHEATQLQTPKVEVEATLRRIETRRRTTIKREETTPIRSISASGQGGEPKLLNVKK